MSTTQGFLASHGAAAFASYLNSSPQFTGEPGGLLRRAGLPENFVVPNPQFGAARLTSNFANSTYHALQVEANRRFASGLMFLANYTWSRTLGEDDGGRQDLFAPYRTLRNLRIDKRLLGFHRTHIVRASGAWELPLRGFRARLLERWQVGAIANIFSGGPMPLIGTSATWNTFGNTPTASAVVPIPKNAGTVRRTGNGVVYFEEWQQIPDPSISSLTTAQNVRGHSNLRAIADASGRLLLVNPTPGQLGNLAMRLLETPGSFQLDLSLLKRISIAEGKTLELRGEAISATNTPQFGGADADINSPNFGRITNAGGNRIVVVGLRFTF
jgi:hypothetical protein